MILYSSFCEDVVEVQMTCCHRLLQLLHEDPEDICSLQVFVYARSCCLSSENVQFDLESSAVSVAPCLHLCRMLGSHCNRCHESVILFLLPPVAVPHWLASKLHAVPAAAARGRDSVTSLCGVMSDNVFVCSAKAPLVERPSTALPADKAAGPLFADTFVDAFLIAGRHMTRAAAARFLSNCMPLLRSGSRSSTAAARASS
jgi:hypothetical protein